MRLLGVGRGRTSEVIDGGTVRGSSTRCHTARVATEVIERMFASAELVPWNGLIGLPPD